MSDDSNCLPEEERPETMREWSCDQIDKFYNVAHLYTIEANFIKTMQMFIFTYVTCVLICQRCKGKKHVGAISIFIAVLSLLESGFCLVRINTLYPFAA